MSRPNLSQLLASAQRVVAFTGAGISTDSGIPDFRSPGGVWSRMKPITFQEFVGSEAKRREAWTRTFSGAARWTGRSPNLGHRAVARLMEIGKVSAIITQNVDNLHQEAGAPPERVIELHGNASYALCLECGLRHELDELRERFLSNQETPRCRSCEGLVKTATISFGQSMPEQAMRSAERETRSCDLFLVLGSSLTVFPAAGFPILAKRSGARLAIINREPTQLDPLADLVVHEEISAVLSSVIQRL